MAKPVLWPRCDQESWSLTPPNRYVVNAEYSDKFQPDQIDSVSDLRGSAYHRPFTGNLNVVNAKVLVERHRSRGTGDLLFMTGPLSFLYEMSGGSVEFYVKSLIDRGTVLTNHPAIALKTALYGPTLYDTLPLYRYHWFVESVTEFNEDSEQPNVYDALYRQIGLDPSLVSPKFKRPSVGFDETDHKGCHAFFHAVFAEKQLDLRLTPYCVIAPFSHGHTRIASYQMWLALIDELAKKMPVIVIGSLKHALPDADISAGEFVGGLRNLCQKSAKIVNLVGEIPIRSIMTIISKAAFLVGLDSAPLYMAQACRVPAVSLWGPHNPAVRIGYDKDYMDLAIHNTQFCPNSPCFTYDGFPVRKCPDGTAQKVCSVLASITVDQVLAKIASLS